ncbi:GNAT superfamily N-acetyltransferase [Inquilinus ginsengisoli]|uniref:GNAT family N-acetyltransferase n=1 Tax=Inquilinus ginsengisoli TaxID=363840 RepID=UPI003D1C4248
MTDDSVRIRPWRPEDRPLGLALFDSNVPRFFAAQERQDFIDFVDGLAGPYFVLEDAAGEAVGCGGYAAAEGDASVAVLCWGMVRGDRHRAGLGTVLLTGRLDRIAADPGFCSAAIETTQHSRGFFARHGRPDPAGAGRLRPRHGPGRDDAGPGQVPAVAEGLKSPLLSSSGLTRGSRGFQEPLSVAPGLSGQARQ